jgi:hypothetical protein
MWGLRLGEISAFPFAQAPVDLQVHLIDEATKQLKCG